MSRTDWSEYKPLVFEYKGRWIKNWFSNMEPYNFFVGDSLWPSVENYYQAMKTEDRDLREKMRLMDPYQAKRIGRRIQLQPNWDKIKDSVMKRALHSKFSQPPWFGLLMASGDTPIVEWNNWGDSYWGADYKTGLGLNRLGVLLMEIRAEYQEINKQMQNNPDVHT